MSPRITFLFLKVLHSQKVNPHLSFKSDKVRVDLTIPCVNAITQNSLS